MAKGGYCGVSNIAHKLKKAYCGVGGVAHNIKKGYIGDANGKARLFWAGGGGQFRYIYGTSTSTSPSSYSIGEELETQNRTSLTMPSGITVVSRMPQSNGGNSGWVIGDEFVGYSSSKLYRMNSSSGTVFTESTMNLPTTMNSIFRLNGTDHTLIGTTNNSIYYSDDWGLNWAQGTYLSGISTNSFYLNGKYVKINNFTRISSSSQRLSYSYATSRTGTWTSATVVIYTPQSEGGSISAQWTICNGYLMFTYLGSNYNWVVFKTQDLATWTYIAINAVSSASTLNSAYPYFMQVGDDADFVYLVPTNLGQSTSRPTFRASWLWKYKPSTNQSTQVTVPSNTIQSGKTHRLSLNKHDVGRLIYNSGEYYYKTGVFTRIGNVESTARAGYMPCVYVNANEA